MSHTALSPAAESPALPCVAGAQPASRESVARESPQARPAPRRAAAREQAAAPDRSLWQALFGTARLSAAEQQAVWQLGQVRHVATGGVVFGHDDVAHALVLVQSGDVTLGWRTADGIFRVERPVHGPGWLDAASAWIDARHAMDALAASDAVIVDWPRDSLLPLLDRHPGVARAFIGHLAGEVRSLVCNTHELMHKDAPARFAAWLLQRCEVQAGRLEVVRLAERKRDIASQLAITPETLSRLMRSLSRQGLIDVAGYTVRVLDRAGLEQVAQAG